MRRAWRHGLFEAARIGRNGEQLLLNLLAPLAIVVLAQRIADFAYGTPGASTSFVVPGALAVAIASSAFTSQAIHTAFERKYGSMRLLGATPLGGRGLVAGKAIGVVLIVAAQTLVIVAVAMLAQDWRPAAAGIGWALLAGLLGIVAFVALGLIVASLLRAEWVLGVANLLWITMVGAGGLLIPLTLRLTPGADALAWTPPGALGNALRTSLVDGQAPASAIGVLAVWALALSALAAGAFRWSARGDIGLLSTLISWVRRLGGWCARHVGALAVANVVGQIAIIVTGGAVRLTSSGLGCTHYFKCEPDHFTPQFTPEAGIHPFIEFGNRLVAVMLLVLTALLAVALWRARPDLRRWAAVPVVGVFLQAVLGAITVSVELNPWVVGPHFLISGVLVWLAVLIVHRERRTTPTRWPAPCWWRAARVALVPSLIAVVFLGVLTTGAGPHSGDSEQTERLALNPAHIAKIHAISVWVFVALVALLWGGLRRHGTVPAMSAVRVLAAVTLIQGAIGYIQYFLGLPVLIVGMHLLGAGMLIAAHSHFHIESQPGKDRRAIPG